MVKLKLDANMLGFTVLILSVTQQHINEVEILHSLIAPLLHCNPASISSNSEHVWRIIKDDPPLQAEGDTWHCSDNNSSIVFHVSFFLNPSCLICEPWSLYRVPTISTMHHAYYVLGSILMGTTALFCSLRASFSCENSSFAFNFEKLARMLSDVVKLRQRVKQR